MKAPADQEPAIDAPAPVCPHPEHRLGTHGKLRKHQRVCMNCGEVVTLPRRRAISRKTPGRC